MFVMTILTSIDRQIRMCKCSNCQGKKAVGSMVKVALDKSKTKILHPYIQKLKIILRITKISIMKKINQIQAKRAKVKIFQQHLGSKTEVAPLIAMMPHVEQVHEHCVKILPFMIKNKTNNFFMKIQDLNK